MATYKRKIYVNFDTKEIHVIEDDIVVKQTFESYQEIKTLCEDKKHMNYQLIFKGVLIDDAHIVQKRDDKCLK